MSDESAIRARKPSPEFWAIIGSAIAVGALVLTVSGWQRSDIQDLRGQIRALDTKLSREIEKVQVGQNVIRERLVRLETLVGVVDHDLAAVIDDEAQSSP